MSITISLTSIKENKLLNRKELEMILSHPKLATPNKKEVTKQLASLHKANTKNVVIYDIVPRFGAHTSKAKAKIYSNENDLKTAERQFVVTRLTGEKPKKVVRRMRKDARKKKAKMFGSLRRNVRKAEKKAKK